MGALGPRPLGPRGSPPPLLLDPPSPPLFLYSFSPGLRVISLPPPAARGAAGAACAFSGFACWPRLQLDPAGTLVVESRGPRGEHQKSHWQTVLQLMSDEPLSIEAGDSISFEFEARPEKAVTKATTYRLGGGVQRG